MMELKEKEDQEEGWGRARKKEEEGKEESRRGRMVSNCGGCAGGHNHLPPQDDKQIEHSLDHRAPDPLCC